MLVIWWVALGLWGLVGLTGIAVWRRLQYRDEELWNLAIESMTLGAAVSLAALFGALVVTS